MKKEFNTYLSSIGLTEVMIGRITSLFDIYQMIMKEKNEEIEDIFISEYVNKEGSRVYQNLWLFSNKYFMTTENYEYSENFNLGYSFKSLNNLVIEKEEYNFKETNEKSRLTIKYIKTFGFRSELKASKENCTSLRNILMRHILPNMK